MIFTQEFLNANNVCAEGQKVADDFNLYGMDIDQSIKVLLQAGLKEDAGWILKAKDTEYYVRQNGSNITMGAYQVFDPISGVHVRYETEAEAKAALIATAKQVLELHCPKVVQELSNENGDTTWVPCDMADKLVIS